MVPSGPLSFLSLSLTWAEGRWLIRDENKVPTSVMWGVSWSLILRSLDTHGEATICEFVNDSDEAVLLYWVPQDGVLAQERRIDCGQTVRVGTFVGDAFAVCSSRPLFSYRPEVPGTHVIRLCRKWWGHSATVSRAPSYSGCVEYRRKSVSSLTLDLDTRIDDESVDVIEQDVRAAATRIPRQLLERFKLRIVVHKDTECFRNCCFHPSTAQSWLRAHGFDADLAGCVQVYNVDDYKKDRGLWGAGGVFVHELAHAVHDALLVDGHANRRIIECYEAAMRAGIYDNVCVKGPQGPTARHYACTNPAEFFAELSTAFLADEATSYNKWQPFNRPELLHFDPDTCRVLAQVWLHGDTLSSRRRRSWRCCFG